MPGQEFEPSPELSQAERLEMLEIMMTRVVATLQRIEEEMDLMIQYTRTSAQLNGLVAQAKAQYDALDRKFEAIIDERKREG